MNGLCAECNSYLSCVDSRVVSLLTVEGLLRRKSRIPAIAHPIKIHASGKPTPIPIFAPNGRPDFAVVLFVETAVDALLLVTDADENALLLIAEDIVVEIGVSAKFHPLTCTPTTPISSVATLDTVGNQEPAVFAV